MRSPAVFALAVAAAATTWIAQSPSVPAGGGSLRGVACPTRVFCMAVGLTSGSHGGALTESWNGRRWALSKITRAAFSYLNGVACTSPSFCVAVGSEVRPGSGGSPAGFAEVWNGRRWRVTPIPDPHGLGPLSIVELGGVTCRSPRACVAVGDYSRSTNFDGPLVERWNGRAWSVTTPPAPGPFLTRLTAVACPASSRCVAVGQEFTDRIGRHSRPFAEMWNGRAWSPQRPPTVHTANLQPLLAAVSCPRVGDCLAVGGAPDASLALHWNGVGWTRLPALPVLGFRKPFLSGVFCSSGSACTVVGFPGDLSAGGGALAATWDGRRWTPAALPIPGVVDSLALGCSDSANCTVVGSRFAGRPGGRELPLAFRSSG